NLQDIGALQLRTAERGFSQFLFILLRRVGCDPGFCLDAEGGFLRGVVEVHGRSFFLSFRGARRANPESRSKLQDSGSAPDGASRNDAYAAFFLRMRSISASSQ